MSQDLFRTVVRPEVHANGGRRGTFVVSLLAHIALLSVVVIAPLVATDVLPSPQEAIGVFLLDPRPPEPPPALGRPGPRVRAAQVQPEAAPPVSYEAPEGIADAVERGPVAIADTAGPIGPGVPHGIPGGLESAVPSPPVPPPPPPQARLVRVGQGVRMPLKLVDVPPVYPRLARDVRREGTVVLEAIIGTDGVVRDVKVLKSVTLLDAAALEAVRQWRYQPTLLNGVSVPVIVTVTVVFRLQH